LTADIKTGGAKSKKWKITKKKNKKSEKTQPSASLSVQLALRETEDTGAKRGVKHKSHNSQQK